MFVYEKKLQYPVKIKNPNPKLAAAIISQYGGPYINRLLSHTATRGRGFVLCALLCLYLALLVEKGLTIAAFLFTMVSCE